MHTEKVHQVASFGKRDQNHEEGMMVTRLRDLMICSLNTHTSYH
jgi:hypothetical protein